MAGRTNSSRTVRVIGLLPAGSTSLASGGFFRLIRVGSGYEAAAELLAEPASALVVDLAMLTAGHGPLLKLAAELNVPVIAFGTVTSALDGSVLAGVRLLGAEQAADALRGLLAGVDADADTGFPSAAPAAPAAEETESSLLDKPLTRAEIDSILSG